MSSNNQVVLKKLCSNYPNWTVLYYDECYEFCKYFFLWLYPEVFLPMISPTFCFASSMFYECKSSKLNLQ